VKGLVIAFVIWLLTRLLRAAPGWVSDAATWRVAQSKRSAVNRIAKLQEELKRLDEFIAQPAKLVAWVAEHDLTESVRLATVMADNA
jgi:hypothetical protein